MVLSIPEGLATTPRPRRSDVADSNREGLTFSMYVSIRLKAIRRKL